MATNVIATSLIAFKTWYYIHVREQILDTIVTALLSGNIGASSAVHLGNGKATKRVLKILALLVESGVVYSILLARLSLVCSPAAHWPDIIRSRR